MSAKVDQLCDDLRDRLNAIERWLESVKADIQALPWKARKTHQDKLRGARAKLQAQKERVEQTRATLKAQPPLAAAIVEMFTTGWMTVPNPAEPNAGPVAAEAHVAAAIGHAVAGIDEVNDAMLSAAAARLHDAAK